MQVIKFYSRDKIEEIPLILETYSLLPKMFVLYYILECPKMKSTFKNK